MEKRFAGFIKYASLGIFVLWASMSGCVPTSFAEQTPLTVATVNVQNAAVVSQSNGVLNIDFDLTNRVGAQPQIKYAVLLAEQGKDGQLGAVIDEKVYGDVVSLGDGDVKHEQVAYAPPAYASGEYSVQVEARNSDGLILGIASAGDVSLRGNGQYIEIVPDTCYLTVSQDVAPTHYLIGQGVDVLGTENLIAHCSVKNSLDKDVTTTPSFSNNYRTIFGALVSTSTLPRVTLPAKSTVALQFEIPKAEVPQAYDATLILDNGPAEASQSNAVAFHYVVHGAGATIQNLVFNSTYYQKGGMAQLSVFWTGAADSFPGSRLGSTDIGPVDAVINISDGSGAPCAAPYSAKGLDQNSPESDFSIPIVHNCLDPRATVALRDAQGTLLAQGTFSVASKNAPGIPVGSSPWQATGLIVGIAMILAAAYFFGREFLWKNFSRKEAVRAGKISAIIFATAAGMIFSAHPAHADTFEQKIVLDTPSHYFLLTYSVNINKSEYAPKEKVSTTGLIEPAVCTNGYEQGSFNTLSALVNSSKKILITGDNSGKTVSGAQDFTAESADGNYEAMFTATSSIIWTGHGTYYADPINYPIRYSVATSGGTPAETLSATLSPSFVSGNTPLTEDLTARVGGTATGPVNYTFYCDRADTGTNITTPFDLKVDGSADTSYTAKNLCSYSAPGIYNEKVIVERGNAPAAQTQALITVGDGSASSCVTSISSPSPESSASGTISVLASASDTNAIKKVELYGDGTYLGLGAERGTSSLYDFSLDTENLSNGTRSLATEAYGTAGNACMSTPVAITVANNAPALPICSFFANPAQIVLPETSNLVYSCSNVSSCSLRGSDDSNYSVAVAADTNTASGVQAVTPHSNTVYSLTCGGIGGSKNYVQAVQAQVTVVSPLRTEVGP